MRISNDGKELAQRRYVQTAERFSIEHHRNIRRYKETMPSGGAMRGAIDKEHLAMAREIAQAHVDCHLEVFVAESLIPDPNDLREMRSEINATVARHRGSEFWTPRPASAGALSILADQIYSELASKVRQMEVESRMPKASVTAAASIHISGHNFAAIQQGGQNNLQMVSIDTQVNAKIEELLTRIDGATDLTALQKLKSRSDLRYVQELTTLESGVETRDAARSKLDDLTAVISLSADLVALGIPIIQIIRASFGL